MLLVFFTLLASAVVFLDQFTKFLVLSVLSPGESVPVVSGIFHLTLVFNRGIAFGLFREHPSVLMVLITISLAVLFFWAARPGHAPSSTRWGIALILGGAAGNWIDRMRFSSVVDFLDFRIWPVFNVADSAITIGVFLYLLCFLKKPGPRA